MDMSALCNYMVPKNVPGIYRRGKPALDHPSCLEGIRINLRLKSWCETCFTRNFATGEIGLNWGISRNRGQIMASKHNYNIYIFIYYDISNIDTYISKIYIYIKTYIYIHI